MSKHWPFFAILFFLVGALALLIITQEQVITQGDEIILATRPVDPRDLFRGEYVILRYEIESSEIASKAVEGMGKGEALYVRVESSASGTAEIVETSVRKPDFSNGIWIKGEVTGSSFRSSVRFPSIEQFYVPEGAGRPIERMRTGLNVKASVYQGEVRITELLDAELNPINPADYIEQE